VAHDALKAGAEPVCTLRALHLSDAAFCYF
jgi:hypothetical protein